MTSQDEQQKPAKTGQILVNNLKALYESFDDSAVNDLGKIYTQDIEFVDPIETTKGLFALKHYMAKQAKGLNYSRFRYLNEMVGENQAYIRWEMVYSHPKLARGKELVLPGMSEIHFTQKIYYQQDSYDMGMMLYEHIPVLGSLIKILKGRLA